MNESHPFAKPGHATVGLGSSIVLTITARRAVKRRVRVRVGRPGALARVILNASRPTDRSSCRTRKGHLRARRSRLLYVRSGSVTTQFAATGD